MANKRFVVEYLIKARDQFTEAANKSRGAVRKFKNEIEDAKRKAREFSESTREMATSARNWGLGITAAAGVSIISLKNAARDAVETRSKFATVFKDIGSQAQTMSKNLADNFGLTQTKAQQLLGDTGDILTGFGFTQKSALELSNQVNELAVDLASFTNFSGGAEGASAALTKALLGERESLKSLGVAISEEQVKRKVAQMMAQGQRFATEQQAKAQATLVLAIEQSKNAIGDFARTSKDLANQERITSSRIQDLKESFGRILLPMMLKVTQSIRGVAEWLNALSPEAKRLIIITGGIVAALGPLLFILGSIGLILPGLSVAFASLGAVAVAALGPIGIIAGGIAIGAIFVMRNWNKVKSFFSGFAMGLETTLGPTITRLIDDFKNAASTIASLFGMDSEAAASLIEFSNLGEFIGEIIGGMLDTIIRGLRGVGEILGQVIGAVTELDFGQFDLAAIKAEFMGTTKQEPIVSRAKVDVGVNVGLSRGLQQTGAASVYAQGVRRADVGASTR